MPFQPVEHITAKTTEYLQSPSVVGHEEVFLRNLESDFRALGLQTESYSELLAVQGNKPHDQIICAHIDRHGLISIGNGQYVYAAHYVREKKYNEISSNTIEQLNSISSRFEGEPVYAYDPKTGVQLGEGVIHSFDPPLLGGVSVFGIRNMQALPDNTPIAYARTARIENDYFKGQIDNTISIGLIHALYKQGFQGTVLFSTEEEIGKSWIHISEYLNKKNIETQNLIVLDTSPYTDADPVKQGLIVFRNRDKSEIFNSDLVQSLKERCTSLNIPFHAKDEYLLAMGKTEEQLGSTELGKLVMNAKGRWSGATVQIPTLMYHTSNETTSFEAIENFYRFLANILIDDPVISDLGS